MVELRASPEVAPVLIDRVPASLTALRQVCSSALGVPVGRIYHDDPFGRKLEEVDSDIHLTALVQQFAARASRQVTLRSHLRHSIRSSFLVVDRKTLLETVNKLLPLAAVRDLRPEVLEICTGQLMQHVLRKPRAPSADGS